ncbi:hypothetical protein [Methanocorpusculum vombati]|nr:hypothetical protein [Methanocorpusculum vombati]MCZ9320301.1 hypothetical protein [Methanocorpusculum sp.]MDE2520040.1 hypothetical protein [Methanocorpusculum sp.]MDE2535169.1 hypothetical protein [Methanocorpusculum sp.]MDE2545356.1 hypothetical protein [Methanocorpusculum sp.]MDE2547139.1 hypothetical protein [Methanocorpusculum sp.]
MHEDKYIIMTELPKPGERIDVLVLRDLRRTEHINIYLYMDEEIARTSDLAADLAKYRLVDPDFRPVMEIEEWFKTIQKQMRQIAGADARVEEMFAAEPLNAEILETGEIQTAVGPRTYLKALLPYLDEMEEIHYSNATMPTR